MTFSAFTKHVAAFAAVVFSLLLCASSLARDFVPKEDVTKLDKPTICQIGKDGLYLVDWDGQNVRLWMTGDFNGPARWSRDGRYASFIVGSYTHYILELETGRLINMTERLNNRGYNHIYISGAWWFPDGRRLACRGNDLNNPIVEYSDIYVLDFRASKLDKITATSFQDDYWASVSADGKRIVISVYPPSEEEIKELGLEGPSYPDQLYTMNADGTDVVNLTYSNAYERYPEWSPDGKKIAFEAIDRPEQKGEISASDLYMMDPDGSNVERLTSRKNGRRALVDDWSADSKWILFHMTQDYNPPAKYYLYRIHVETREIVRITGSGSARWVYAGKSRFLSVDPAGKTHGQWGDLKEAEETETPQEENSADEE